VHCFDPLIRSLSQVVKQQLYLNRPRRSSSMSLDQGEKPTLDNVMSNPKGFKALEDFLKLEFSVRAWCLLCVPTQRFACLAPSAESALRLWFYGVQVENLLFVRDAANFKRQSEVCAVLASVACVHVLADAVLACSRPGHHILPTPRDLTFPRCVLFIADSRSRLPSQVLEAQADGSPENLDIVHMRAVELYEKYVKTGASLFSGNQAP
jgi:hypothetical protein